MRKFNGYDEMRTAIKLRGEEDERTWEFEDDFIELLKSESDESDNRWEVVQISSGVAAFLVNVEEPMVDPLLVARLHSKLLTTIPTNCVYLHVFDGLIDDPISVPIAAVAILRSELWVWSGESSKVATMTDSWLSSEN